MRHSSSPTIRLIRQHYESIGVYRGWDDERVRRLSRMLGCTMDELAVSVGIGPSDLRRYMFKREMPPVVALHFAFFESWYLVKICKAPQKPVVPMNLLVKAGDVSRESVGGLSDCRHNSGSAGSPGLSTAEPAMAEVSI